jgi:aldehyde:ferredoxin oxidoreductase
MKGLHNRIAWIDLSRGEIAVKPLDRNKVDLFLSGSGLAAAYLYEMTGTCTDPLGPENPLILMTGLFVGTPVPLSTRHVFVTLSPLTGGFAESSCGGSLAWHLKRAGLDGVVITGAARAPVALVIDDRNLYLRPSPDLWGQDAFRTDEILRAEMDPGGVTAVIGQAGENLVRFASVSHNGRHTRSAGRCGIGAVMGSKKLKAIMVTSRGKRANEVAFPQELKTSMAESTVTIRERLKLFGELGTSGGVASYEALGNLPINNWRGGSAPELAARITGSVTAERLMVKRTGCFRCPVRCGRLVEVTEGPFATEGAVEGPEYETVAAMGSLCMVDDLDAIAKANELCNRFGLDTMSTGGVIAFAMEANEKGLLKRWPSDDLDLSFGNAGALVVMIERIARREGALARLLGEGVSRSAKEIGPESEEFAVTTKGLEFPLHDPRFSWGQALSFATSNRGACHLAGLCHLFELSTAIPELGYDKPFPRQQREGKAAFVIGLQHVMTLADSLCLCKFAFISRAVTLTRFHQWFVQVSGLNCTLDEFLQYGERIFNLKRLINHARGIGRKDDILPPRMRTLKRRGPNYEYDVPPVGEMLTDYYELRGWREDGRPMVETLERLGMDRFVESQPGGLPESKPL